MKNYYYFVTSLKDISLGIDKLPCEISDFLEETKDVLAVKDRSLLDALLLQYDNENLVNLLEKNDKEFNKFGLWTLEQLEEEIKEPSLLPEYMLKFLESIQFEERVYLNYSLKDELSIYYYKYLMGIPNKFLQEYGSFNFNLRNVFVALNARKYDLSRENNVLLLHELAIELIQSSSSDFGLTADFDWLPEVINLFEDSNVLGREEKILVLRVNFIDSMLLFDYFNINTILGYFEKMILLDRLINFNHEKGTKIFNDITNKLSDENKIFAEISE
ncbi:MAG: DUF2764 family protein [Bacteriovoracaceae bacterium]|nr:DUF2764 family protein [Bacteriovoracaceae bacterium]